MLGKQVGAGVLAGAAVLLLAAPSSAPGAVTIGPDPLPQRSSVIGQGGARIFANDVVPGASLTSPLDGVVVRWRARRGSGPGVLQADTLTLRILHPTGVANQFTTAGTSEPHPVPGGDDPIDVYEFPTRLPIQTGDRVGLGTVSGTFPALALIGASYLHRINPLTDGQTATFDAGSFGDRAVLINADVEPDADGDGFGDETQDACPTDAGTQGTCPPDIDPPETEITKGAPNKTEKTKLRFKFTSDEPGSTFECKADKKPFRSCSSPKKVKRLDEGKHKFKVRATDAAGNVDPSAAKDKFKVVD